MTSIWGTVPAWIGSIAGLLAFGATAPLLWIERNRRAEERIDRNRAVANRVSHWLNLTSDGILSLNLVNASESVIYYVEIYFYLEEELLGKRELNRLEPTKDALAPHDLTAWLTKMFHQRIKRTDKLRVDFLFTDPAGRNWVRDLNGALVFLEKRDQKAGKEWLIRRYAIDPDRSRVDNESDAGSKLLRKAIHYSARNLDDKQD